jgi:hypothetical protein
MRSLKPRIIGAAILVFALSWSFPPLTRAQGIDYCPRTTIPLTNSFADLPIGIDETAFASSYETTGYLRFENTSGKRLDAVSVQVEYSAKTPTYELRLSFETDVSRKARFYSEKLSQSIAPGQTISLSAVSFEAVTSCPEIGRVVNVRIRFSDGTNFDRHLSEWQEPPMPLAIQPVEVPVGTLADHDVGYLVRLSLSARGKVVGLEEMDSNSMPESLRKRLSEWLFHPKRENGVALPGTLYAVVRIHAIHCEIQNCPVPFSKSELPDVFTFVDLVPDKSTSTLRTFAVYFGGFPVSGNGGLSWY